MYLRCQCPVCFSACIQFSIQEDRWRKTFISCIYSSARHFVNQQPEASVKNKKLTVSISKLFIKVVFYQINTSLSLRCMGVLLQGSRSDSSRTRHLNLIYLTHTHTDSTTPHGNTMIFHHAWNWHQVNVWSCWVFPHNEYKHSCRRRLSDLFFHNMATLLFKWSLYIIEIFEHTI